MRQQLEGLEHETQLGLAQAGAAVLVEREDILPGQDHLAAGRGVQTGKQTEQSRLAGARRADNGERLSRLHCKIHAVKDGQLAAGVGDPFGQVDYLDGGRHRAGIGNVTFGSFRNVTHAR